MVMGGLGTLIRSTIRPGTRPNLLLNLLSPSSTHRTISSPFSASVRPFHWINTPWMPPPFSASRSLHSLTDTRFPKRRPMYKPRRKRASLKPPGPYAWVKYVPGEPILPNNPNEGSVKGRLAKKRIRQKRAFILSEKKKRKAQMQEAKRKKIIKRVERKMAAVARDRAWAIRLAELQRLEEEKKMSMA